METNELDLLRNSCSRLPKLVEMDSPAAIIVQEYRILSNLALTAIDEAISRVTRRELERWRKHKATKAAGVEALDIMDVKGRHNPEGNSIMLWEKDWDRLRAILQEAAEAAKEEG